MGWADFVTFFSSVDVCRVRADGWAEARMHSPLPALLPPASGSIRAYHLFVSQACQAEFTLLQPSQRGKASRGKTAAPPRELMLLLLRRGDAGRGGHETSLRPLSCSERSAAAAINCEAVLSAGVYCLLPLSLQPAAWAPPLVLRLGSSRPLTCDAIELSALEAAAALGAYARRGERQDAFDGMRVYTLQDEMGLITYAENGTPSASRRGFQVQLDYSGSRNVKASRAGPRSSDVIQPMRGQLLQVLSADSAGAEGSQMRCAMQCATFINAADSHKPEVGGCYAHAPFPLSSVDSR